MSRKPTPKGKILLRYSQSVLNSHKHGSHFFCVLPSLVPLHKTKDVNKCSMCNDSTGCEKCTPPSDLVNVDQELVPGSVECKQPDTRTGVFRFHSVRIRSKPSSPPTSPATGLRSPHCPTSHGDRMNDLSVEHTGEIQPLNMLSPRSARVSLSSWTSCIQLDRTDVTETKVDDTLER
ncbi:unnamed protein product [Echinostoma caproni]|uniref:Si:ch73-389k6.1 n=1 Tax=Echinostoma caproni TaxID=27848 RepID=A0A183AC36_9TREM|nr:unnamed protein product [Echinostoma caproni]